jgi:hypothetical protein
LGKVLSVTATILGAKLRRVNGLQAELRSLIPATREGSILLRVFEDVFAVGTRSRHLKLRPHLRAVEIAEDFYPALFNAIHREIGEV